MSKNPLFRSGEENEKVIRNPYADPDHHQKLIASRGSPPCLCLPRLVDVRFRVPRLSCLQYDRQNDHITSALSAEVMTRTRLVTIRVTNNAVSHPRCVQPLFGFAHRREERTVLGVDAVDAVPLRYLLVVRQEVLCTCPHATPTCSYSTIPPTLPP